jgi:hypothetical protein
MEHAWKAKGDGKYNARTWECVSLSEGGSWISLVDSLPRLKGAHGESKQTSKGGTNGSSWSAKASTTNKHIKELGGVSNRAFRIGIVHGTL